MGYQSKYTGAEIDEKLDLIGSGGLAPTTLFEGEYELISNTSTDTNFLSDNVLNYDFVMLVVGTKLESGYLTRYNCEVYPSDALVSNQSSTEVMFNMSYADNDSVYAYICLGDLGDGTQIRVSNMIKQGTSVNRKLILSKVIGFKNSGGIGGTEIKAYGIFRKVFASANTTDYYPIDTVLQNNGIDMTNGTPRLKAGKTYKITLFNGTSTYFNGNNGQVGGDICDENNNIINSFARLTSYCRDYSYDRYIGNEYSVQFYTPESDTDLYFKLWQFANTSQFDIRLMIEELTLSSSEGSGYKEVELLSAPVEYSVPVNNTNFVNADLAIEDISDFDEIVITSDLGSASGYNNTVTERILKSSIIFNNSDNQVNDGSRITTFNFYTFDAIYRLGWWFKSNTTLRINFTGTNQGSSFFNTWRIRSIKGVKY